MQAHKKVILNVFMESLWKVPTFPCNTEVMSNSSYKCKAFLVESLS